MDSPSSAAVLRRSAESPSDDNRSDSSSFTASTSPSTVNDNDVLTALNCAHLPTAGPTSFPLFRGNAIFDIPVSPALLAKTSSSSSSDHETHERTEFSHVRYSALTCRPTDFVRSGYTLRPELYGIPRATGILVSVIVRGEGVDAVLRSLDSVRNGVRALCSRQRATPWGPGSWKKVLLVVVCDGEQRPETKALFAALGMWNDRFRASRVGEKQVIGHLFEVDESLFLLNSNPP